MRFDKPREHQERIVKRFALLPICISGECRWLEWVTIKQRYCDWNNGLLGWKNAKFIDE